MAFEAVKAAEREAKAKADKVQEIKKVKHAISLVDGEKSKLTEILEDAETHRAVSVSFVLDGGVCTPEVECSGVQWSAAGSSAVRRRWGVSVGVDSAERS
jgi:hypothetical protein